ncbi:DesA family fatty acid desaturase [Legionella micdadei]|uniref:Fatty acid desaturase n=1 Tax=Legionella micdadei TaxID=451 RepID=A0A098GDC3_LEGMI|nr:fatty acid desaturase [Legionella micdadei]ARH01060.1 acyl-CoA desaturase [Legionella micdadei]KTD27240.1 stearoyl-CoA-9-desaturase [Legionella micdadei]NSL18627.1 fatty acid desaturase [Legionella micdadei]CEG60020.1 Fatty acid desaturase [Legionella micdadei]SCY61726.1 stearoyl-CoA desaturase (delta-9 desaturase) [Legionella micdadei]
MIFGILNLTFWGYIFALLLLTQITIASVTLYLHRCQTHRAVTLHPTVSHFFRFWIWLTTGMETRVWVAIHRKHHAMTDVEGDPHSPQVFSIKKVFWQVPELYREAAKDKNMIEKYSHGTPDDWIEHNLYSRYSNKGVLLMFLIDLLLFGFPGITIWAIQMMWIPLSAGVVNGVGHYWGYRNFECSDKSTNVLPWGFLIGGEELHNNHHTYASSAKFSVKWWEFDLGWFYIRCLSFLGLAKVKKLPPKLARDNTKLHADLNTIKAVIGNRFQIMSDYYKRVTVPVLKNEKRNHLKNKKEWHLFKCARRLLRQESTNANSHLLTLLNRFEQLQLVYSYRQSLQQIWLKKVSSQKELIESLNQWCKKAEESGLDVLHQFSLRLKSYVLISKDGPSVEVLQK